MKVDQFAALEIINQVVYGTANMTFLVGLIVMVYRIRHINDNTKIGVECAYICLWGVLCSTLQFVIFILIKANLCFESQFSNGTGTVTLAYYSTVVRNFVTMLITIYF